MEQPHQAADITRRGGVGLLLGMLAPREGPDDQPVGHVEHSIGQPGFQVEQYGDQGRAPPMGGVAAEQIGGRRLSLPDELAEPDFGKARHEVGRDPDGTDDLKLAEQVADMPGLWCARHRLQPGERGSTEFGIDDRQPVEFGQLLVGETGKQRVRRPLAGSGTPGGARALDHRQGGQDELFRAECGDDGGDDHSRLVRGSGGLGGGFDHEGKVGIG